jgi:tetratricopeptide (TPR) repeat protein
MRRFLPATILAVIAATAGAAVYVVYATEQEYERLMTDGDAAAANGKVFEALEAYSGAIALRPDSMVAHLKRGVAYHRRGELGAAFKDLRTASELDPTATRPLELLGDVSLELGRYERAAERYEAYLAIDDSSARLYYKLGLARYRARDFGSAIEPLQHAVRLDNSLATAHLLLGLCLREQGQLRPARSALEMASSLEPSLTTPREALASLYQAMGDTRRAIDQLEALVALDNDSPARVVALGRAYADAGRHDAAVLTLGRAVERFPDSSTAYAALGRVWLEAAEQRRDQVALRKAVEALSTAASHADATSEALTDLGRAWLLSGDRTAAERALRQAVAKLPVAPDAFLHLAAIAERAGRVQEARDSLVQYATLVGTEDTASRVVARIVEHSLELGEPHVAARWVERAITDEGVTPELLALKRATTAALP